MTSDATPDIRDRPVAAFRHSMPVMFQHCDPAGIVFYPRYFEMINAVVETFFDTAVGWSFARMHGADRVGVPMRRIATEFMSASRLGDGLDWDLRVSRIGGSSLDLTLGASCAGEARLGAEATLVLVDLDQMAPLRWPDARRAILERYKEG